nr:helix-turn-helix domain-containing protein [Embleya hyalina]
MMLYSSTALWSILPDLDLPPATMRVLARLQAVQQPGGLIVESQVDIASALGLSQVTVSRSMRTLRDRNLVIGSRGSKRLHPLIAGYASSEDYERAAIEAVRRDDIPDITVPLYVQPPPRVGHAPPLSAVS